MNSTPDLYQRYLSGIPAQQGYPVHEPARPKSAMPRILMAVVGVVCLILLAFYVALILPLLKKSQQLMSQSSQSKTLLEPESPEEGEPEEEESEVIPKEPEDVEESPTGGSPRR